jgi:hypothetical protein
MDFWMGNPKFRKSKYPKNPIPKNIQKSKKYNSKSKSNFFGFLDQNLK